jgi:hypothetical protein
VPELVEFPLEGGGSVFVEVEGPFGVGREPTRGLGRPTELTVAAGKSFQEAFSRIQPAAAVVIEQLRGLVDPPDDIEVEFGIQLNAEFGAVVAKGGAEANFRVRMQWSGGTER